MWCELAATQNGQNLKSTIVNIALLLTINTSDGYVFPTVWS